MSPRIARSQLATYTYFHICARGNNGQDIFMNNEDRCHYLSLLEKYRQRSKLKCYAYCLMNNHMHLLLQSSSTNILSKTMQGIHLAYVRYYNRRHGRSGHLFQDRFSSWVIRNEKHLMDTKEYIENNPVKAGLVVEKKKYLWSSACRDGSAVTIDPIEIWAEPSPNLMV